MESGESPLDVLSRAATMLQESQQGINGTDDSSKQGTAKQLPTTKWKRDRRTRADYLRKSDPKLPDELVSSPENGPSNGTSGNGTPINGSFSNGTTSNGSSPEIGTNGQVSKGSNGDTPLDMSTRQRGQPPSYMQTINNPTYRSNYRPSVITHNNGFSNRNEMPSGISMCDPIIDEHFRRSLGKDYMTIFSNNNVAKETQPARQPTPPKTTNPGVIELMDNSGMSVDDHFAKALGDTWLKLNKKESEIQSNTSEGHGVVTI